MSSDDWQAQHFGQLKVGITISLVLNFLEIHSFLLLILLLSSIIIIFVIDMYEEVEQCHNWNWNWNE